MAEFAEWFSHHAIGLKNGLISDATALSGRWDFTLVYDPGDHFGTPSPSQTEAPPIPRVVTRSLRQCSASLDSSW